jgi:hypothetical protein
MSQNEHTFWEQPRENLKKEAGERGKKGQTDKSNWFKTEDGQNGTQGEVDANNLLEDFASAVPEGENKGNYTSTITADDSVLQNCDELISDVGNTGDFDKTIISDDPATWPKVICDDLRIKLVNQGPQQITDVDFPKSDASNRKFLVSYYKQTLKNRETMPQKWLLYSVSTGSVYCFCCILFKSSNNVNVENNRFLNGYNNWKKLSTALKEHELGISHINCYCQWQELHKRLHLLKTIDSSALKLLNKEKEKLKLLYEQIIAVILFLCSRNLAFRGSDDHLGSNSNGNFLGLLELLAKYDIFLAGYLSNIRESKACIQHLSIDLKIGFYKI